MAQIGDVFLQPDKLRIIFLMEVTHFFEVSFSGSFSGIFRFSGHFVCQERFPGYGDRAGRRGGLRHLLCLATSLCRLTAANDQSTTKPSIYTSSPLNYKCAINAYAGLGCMLGRELVGLPAGVAEFACARFMQYLAKSARASRQVAPPLGVFLSSEPDSKISGYRARLNFSVCIESDVKFSPTFFEDRERMRIRKRGNARTGESSGAQRPGGVGGSHQEQLVASSLEIAQYSDKIATDVERDTIRDSGEEKSRGGTGISAGAGIHERAGIADSTSRPSQTLVVDLWQSDRGTFNPSESYMNLDEFVTSLAREKCFPADELADQPRVSSVTPTVQINDRHFERLAGGSSMASQSSSFEELDTSLRLGQASHPAMARREERGKSKMGFSKEFESDSENDGQENFAPEFHVNRRGNSRAVYDTSGDGTLEGRNQKSSPSPSPIEECDESNTVRPVSNLADAQLELEPSALDLQTMKSSTEAWFSKKRRVSEDTGSPNRRRPPSPAPTTTAADHPAKQPRRSPMFSLYTVYHEAGREGLTAGEAMSTIMLEELPGFEDPECRSRRHVTKLLRSSPYFMELGEGKFALCSAMIDEEEDDPSEEAAGSDSSQRPEASRLPVSSSSLPMTDNEKRNEEVEFERTANERGGTATAGASSQPTERKPSGRSGRPKRLKYLKQDNVEELGNQCNRSDGKGWTCPLLAKTGYQLCDHHLDKLRCKPGSRSKYNKKKKKHN